GHVQRLIVPAKSTEDLTPAKLCRTLSKSQSLRQVRRRTEIPVKESIPQLPLNRCSTSGRVLIAHKLIHTRQQFSVNERASIDELDDVDARRLSSPVPQWGNKMRQFEYNV